MIIFYVNDFCDTCGNYIRNCRKQYIKRYLEPYGVKSKFVKFNKSNPVTREFLMNVLAKQAEVDRGIESIARRGMFKMYSPTLKQLAKYDCEAIRDWKLMLIERRQPLTVKNVVDWLLEHPFFINTFIMYDDETDMYYTTHMAEGCKAACKRKARSVRRKLNYERLLLMEGVDHNDDVSSSGHADFWASQEEEFEYKVL